MVVFPIAGAQAMSTLLEFPAGIDRHVMHDRHVMQLSEDFQMTT
jgi:hypothetical protein